MTHDNNTNAFENGSHQKNFETDARMLSDEKRQLLTDKGDGFETDCRDRGTWLGLFCPDDVCLRDEERINIPVFCSNPEAVKDPWLDTFCPDSRCEISEATNLP